MHGGLDGPMEFRKTIHDLIFDGKIPEKKDRSSKSNGSKPRPRVRSDPQTIQRIKDFRERMGKPPPTGDVASST